MTTTIEAAQDIRDNMLTDLDHASDLTTKLAAVETALTDFCTAAAAHNARVTHWRQQMRTAGYAWQPGSTDYGDQKWELRPDGGIALAATAADAESVTRQYLPLRAGDFIGALLYRVMHSYPEDFTRYTPGQSLAHWGDLHDASGPVDLTALIGRAA
jgi:hypothetical protein